MLPRYKSSPFTPARDWNFLSFTSPTAGTPRRIRTRRRCGSTTPTDVGYSTWAASPGPAGCSAEPSPTPEDAGEELRLLYVALTRAQCAAVIWWAPSTATAASPLHRLLFGRTAGDPQPAATVTLPEDAAARSRLAAWAASDNIALEPVDVITPRHWIGAARTAQQLSVAHFNQQFDHSWRRTSYSALTASAHDAPMVFSESETTVTADEPAEPPTHEKAADGPASLMNGLPSGAAFGTLVHEVLETLDSSAPELLEELQRCCRTAISRRLTHTDPVALAEALHAVVRTPLGTSGCLSDIASADRLAELDFELPLTGGDTPTKVRRHLRDVAGLLRRHLPAADPLVSYAHLLECIDAPMLRGYLAGSIDAVLRRPGPTYVVIDYKTNRLGRGDLTAMHYTPEAMATEMLRAHYPLQALLYCVALHRFLRWRQPGYDPAQHLGGVQYLFVRGMVGPQTPPGCGVFNWAPPAPLIVDLSDLLAGR